MLYHNVYVKSVGDDDENDERAKGFVQDRPELLVSLTGAGYRHADRWLVRGVDLTVASGEIVTLIGPNGSGKSTTAKLALGLLKPGEGSARRRADLTVGYVPQKMAIDWTLPLRVNRFLRLTGPLSEAGADRALEATDALHLRDAEVRTLSGGEFQRVLLARAIAREPALLVLDEPVQGVDYAGETALYSLIARIRDELSCGVLLISHDLHIVMAETDRVICLNGHVCCSGTPRDVASSEAYRMLFGMRAAPAIAIYEHRHDHTHLPDGRIRQADGTITDHCDHAGHAEGDGHDHKHRTPAGADGVDPKEAQVG